jgi:hypothetical protein
MSGKKVYEFYISYMFFIRIKSNEKQCKNGVISPSTFPNPQISTLPQNELLFPIRRQELLIFVSAVVTRATAAGVANCPQMAINSQKQAQKVPKSKNDKKLLKNNNKLSKNDTAHSCTNANKTAQKCKK